MAAWEYIVNSLGWSLGGLCTGYLLGRADRRARTPNPSEEDQEHDDLN